VAPSFPEFAVNHKTTHAAACLLCGHLAALCPAAAMLWLPQPVDASEWTVKPSLSLTENYSDNIRHAPRGNEQSDWITQISPGLNLTGAGPKLTFSTVYQMQNLFYAKNRQSDSTRHSLSTNTHTELINNQLFLDGIASVSQQNTGTLGPQTLNNFNITANQTEVRSLSISPYLRHRFQGWANSEVRYNHGVISTNAVGLAKNQTDSVLLSLDSGYSFTTLRWGMHYNNQKSSSGNSLQTVNSDTYAGNLGYMITPRFTLNAKAGYEKFNYISVAKPPQGPHYSAGFTWAPSQRTNIDASIGHRFFGQSFSLNARHRSRKTLWNLGYSEDVTTTQAQFQANAGLPAPILPGSTNFLSNQIFLQKSLSASVTMTGHRNTLNFNLFDSSRDAQTSQTQNLALLGAANLALGNKSKQLGGNASWSRQISPYTSTNLTLGYIKNSFPALNITSNDKNIQLGINSKLQPDLGYSVSLRHNQYTSTLPNSDSQENALTATLLMQF